MVISLLAFALTYWTGFSYLGTALETPAYYIASLIFEKTTSPQELIKKYEKGNIKILIVPGHNKESYGAQYRGVTEASLNAELGSQLFEYFRSDPKFTAFITNKNTGEYNDWISDYLKNQETAINTFKEKVKSIFKNAVKIGAIKIETKVYHNPAADNSSKLLYGINKWANDSGVDIVLHLHFNDYPGRKYDMPGKYNGFAIYIPDDQLPNHQASLEIAKSIRKELKKIQTESNFPKEKDIIIEDQQLIAIGSNASRDGVSILVEYGYIYEPEFYDKEIRPYALRDAALTTYQGVKNFFEKKSVRN
ncbi:hypothetical protein A3G55_00175 [Candidatus Giovannonibacteria bacterium RIFCSPLOWO2_12_FULL_44_25]|nr:MAG: hypothetical protein A2656_01595 [Candidatus Giovannonibacteria bacterium RIFCSPHIGHO2_01_FULL_44_100]OGF94229.1 MAG: hypothetical protein A3G55_00175 [Candidatus Giovannonibacteria bacterium RIFCSPLOWO2_12_FULL_44_25]